MKQKTSPLVSVIITNYNYAPYINEAIDSVFDQTYKNIEIIVIDDGSTDDSLEKIKNYKHIRLHKQKNQGVVRTRNKGIELANGEFILFLDSDDRLPDNYVSEQIKKATENSLDVVYTDYQRFGAEDSVAIFPAFSLDEIKARNIVHMSSLIRKSAIGDHRFDENLNRLSHEDWDFFLGLALRGAKFGKASGVKLFYRAHGQSRNVSTSGEQDRRTYAYKFVKTYFYIIEKYKQQYPGKIDITESSEIVVWCEEALARRVVVELQTSQIKDLRDDIALKEEIITTLNLRLEKILNSKRYRVGKILFTPVSVISRAIGRRGK